MKRLFLYPIIRDPQKEIEDEFNKVKNDHFPTCQIEFCKNPNQTEPILVRNRLEEGEELDINSPLLRDGGTRFSDNFTQQYYKKATRHFRVRVIISLFVTWSLRF